MNESFLKSDFHCLKSYLHENVRNPNTFLIKERWKYNKYYFCEIQRTIGKSFQVDFLNFQQKLDNKRNDCCKKKKDEEVIFLYFFTRAYILFWQCRWGFLYSFHLWKIFIKKIRYMVDVVRIFIFASRWGHGRHLLGNRSGEWENICDSISDGPFLNLWLCSHRVWLLRFC